MTGFLLIIVSIIYFIVGLIYGKNHNIGLMICFVCYAIANLSIYYSGLPK